MLLNELVVKDTHYASQRNIDTYLDMYKDRIKKAKRVKTNDPAVELAVYGSPALKMFTVFPMVDDEPAGFVEFSWPEKLGQRRGWSSNVRTPHSGLKEKYHGKGLAKMIYRWFLDAGHILVTGDLQTPASNALWKSLSRNYEVVFFDDRGEFIDAPTERQATQRNVRMALLGTGLTREDLFK